MDRSLITHETRGDVKHLNGRDVYWLQTPQYTNGKYSSVCCVIYQPGNRSIPAHSHASGEITAYIVSGTGKFKIGDDVYDVIPGSVILCPQGSPHMIWNNGTEELKMICFFAPGIEAIKHEFHPVFDDSELF
ncbi:MAG: cupin domain-containing protein [Bacillota bacterium]